MSEIIEQVKRAVLSNPERPNAAGLEVIDAEIARERGKAVSRRVEMAELVQPKGSDS
jgi:hypothetical protein